MENAKLLFKPTPHELIARVHITLSNLAPVVDKPVLLNLDKLGASVIQEPALRNRKGRLNPKIRLWRPANAESFNHGRPGRMFLSSWKFVPEFRPEKPDVGGAKSGKRFKLDRKGNFNDGWICKVGQPGLRFAHFRPCELALSACVEMRFTS